MQRTLYALLTVVTAFILAVATNSWARSNHLPVNPGFESVTGVEACVILESDSRLQVEFNLPQRAQGAMLPVTRWVIVPPRRSVTLNILYPEAAERNPKSEPPPSAVVLGHPRVIRGVRMVPVTICPLQLHTDGEELPQTSRIVVELEFSPDGGEDAALAHRRIPITPNFARLLEAFTLNPPRTDHLPGRDLAAPALSRMLVVYSDAIEDEEALGCINEFVEWKRRMGLMVDVEEIDIDDNAYEEVKELAWQLLDDEKLPLEYMTIIGDDELGWSWDSVMVDLEIDDELFFPAYGHEINDTTTVFRDHYYTTDPEDEEFLMPQFALGRMMVPNYGSLAGALRRTIDYERDPYLGPEGDGAWFTRALFTMQTEKYVTDEGDTVVYTPQDVLELARWGRNRLSDAGYDEVVILRDLSEEDRIAEVREQLEEGVSLALADGWLLGAFGPIFQWDEYADTDRMNPFMIANGIYYENPIMYPFFSLATADEPIGPVAGMGLFFDPRSEYMLPIIGSTIAAMAYNEIYTTGYLQLITKLELVSLTELDVTDAIREEIILHLSTFRLLGDPSLEIFTANPVPLAAEHPESYNVGATSVVLTVTDDNEEAVSEAVVCIRQPGSFQYVLYTDGAGNAAFTIPEGIEEGELQLTVHKHNYRPYVRDIPVEVPELNLILGEFGFDDDELGDDDGNFRNGEEVELIFTISNLSDIDAEDVTVQLSSNNPHLAFSPGEVVIERIPAGESAGPEELVSMTLEPETPGGTALRIQLDALTGDELWPMAAEVTSSGPVIYTGEDLIEAENFFPGDTAQITPTLRNIGDLEVPAMEARLTSLDERVTVTAADRNYPMLEPDSEEGPDEPFQVEIDPLVIRGEIVHFELRLSAEDDYDTTMTFALRVADPREGDPFGPDEYGYICFDGDDEDWVEAPIYNWREINEDIDDYEFRGTRVELLQCAQGWDSSAVVELPEGFGFRYYGQDFDQVVICTNGWLAMGDQATEFSSDHNRPIPGAAAPDAQLCPLWQNLRNPHYWHNGAFYHYIEEEGLFIVEWSNLLVDDTTGMEHNVSFEVLLFDPSHYPTPTGDGEIIFQYQEFHAAEGSGDEISHPFATVGIRNLDGSGGLQYAYWNEYPAQAHPLESEFAIKFTTTALNDYGAARGWVVRAGDREEGIDSALIYHPRFPTEVWTNEEGYFTITPLHPDTYEDVLVIADNFNTDTLTIEITAGDTAEMGEIALTNPELELTTTPASFENLSLRPDGTRLHAKLFIDNHGNGPLDYEVRIANRDGSEPAFGDVRHHQISAVDGNDKYYGGVYIDSLFYMPSKHRSGSVPRYRINVLNRAGEEVRYFKQPEDIEIQTETGYYNLAWDGRHFWGSILDYRSGGWIVIFEPDGDVIDAFPTPFDEYRTLPLTYSPERGTIFAADRDTDVIEMETDSARTIINRWEMHLPAYNIEIGGLAWNSFDPDDMNLYLLDSYDPVGGNARARLMKMNPNTGEWRVIAFLDGRPNMGAYRGLSVLHNYGDLTSTVIALVEDGGPNMPDYLRLYDAGPNVSFLMEGGLTNRTGSVSPDQMAEVGMLFDAAGWQEGVYEFGLSLIHNAGETVLAPVSITFTDTAGTGDSAGDGLPTRFDITAVYPNPFNSMVRVEFAVDAALPTTLVVYDLTGREVTTVFDGVPAVGYHRLSWDGSSVASGVYILRLESAGRVRTAKTAIVR